MKHPVLAVFIVIFAFISISIALMALQVKKISSSGFIIKTLDQSGIYPKIPDLVNQTLKDSENGANIISTSLDPAFIRGQIEKNLPGFLAYLNGKSKKTRVEIDIRPYSSFINTAQINELQKQIDDFSKLPPCTAGATPEPSGNLTCVPNDQDFKDKIASTEKVLAGLENGVLKLDDIPNIDKSLASAKRPFHILNLTFLISTIISLILLGLLILLGRNPWQRALRWVGFTLLLPGAFQFALFVVGKASLNPLLTSCIGKINTDFAATLKPVILVFVNNIFNISMLYAGIVFFGGLIMIVLSYIFHAENVRKVQNVQPVRVAK